MNPPNEILFRYIDNIMSRFEGFDENRGFYLPRNLNSEYYNHKLSQTQFRILYRMVICLCANDFLDADDDLAFIRLSKKGKQYLQGAKDFHINPSLGCPLIVDYTKGEAEFFNDLWLMIGKEGEAPFYIEDEILFGFISQYLSIGNTFQEFLNTLRQEGKSISRVSWLEDLVSRVPKDKWKDLLEKLSDLIEHVFFTAGSSIQSSEVKKSNMKVFISYTHEDEEYNNWVAKLASDLERSMDVEIDYKLALGKEWTKFMEGEIKSSDKVLLILTPTYKEKADNRKGGAGYETSIITQELWTLSDDKVKFIPIVRKGTFEESYPTYLGSRNGLDMTEDKCYESNLSRLIETLSTK